jgi:citrate synthase
MFYLLLTGKYPTNSQLHELQKEWRIRGDLCEKTKKFILNLPREFHPMTMLSMTLLYLQPNSKFFKAYQSGVHKSKYWEYYYEDAIDLLARLPHICATIYRHKYRHS